ncbi:MOSC domain-containing protein [Haloferacaceae archaeon DSL9]
MARISRLTTYPIKSLDGWNADSVSIVENGGLAGDREYALVDGDGEYVNGKRERRIHRIRTAYRGTDHRAERVSISAPGRPDESLSLTDEAERDELADWLTGALDRPVAFRRDPAGGLPDDTVASGPTIISTATLEELASWFDGIDVDGMRRRLRANIELDGVPAFWEDRLFVDRDRRVRFSIGEATMVGVNPCQRCVVPTRDPDTGTPTPSFRERFVEMRAETMPAWSGGDWFDHAFRVMVNTAVPQSAWGATLRVGDEVAIEATIPAADSPA